MPIKNFEKYEDEALWCYFDEEEEASYYFLTKISLLNWCKKKKINITEKTIIFQEEKN